MFSERVTETRQSKKLKKKKISKDLLYTWVDTS